MARKIPCTVMIRDMLETPLLKAGPSNEKEKRRLNGRRSWIHVPFSSNDPTFLVASGSYLFSTSQRVMVGFHKSIAVFSFISFANLCSSIGSLFHTVVSSLSNDLLVNGLKRRISCNTNLLLCNLQSFLIASTVKPRPTDG